MFGDEAVEDEPKWTAKSCLLAVAAIVLIGVVLVVGVLLVVHAIADLNLGGDNSGPGPR